MIKVSILYPNQRDTKFNMSYFAVRSTRDSLPFSLL